jgi:hypothetical protein
MRTKIPPVLTLIGTLLACGVVPDPSADAVQSREYYTRKRVNGVWITGYFERKRPDRSPADPSRPADRSGDTPRLPTSVEGAADEDRPPFQRAAEARRSVVDAAFAGVLPPEPGLLPLRQALETRARIMATVETGRTASARAIRSVTLDFERFTRTIQFVDGSRTEEPFEPAMTGGLNANALP